MKTRKSRPANQLFLFFNEDADLAFSPAVQYVSPWPPPVQ